MTKPPRKLRFIQVLPVAPTDGNFLLRDLPGSGRRLDVLCRDLAACFDWGPVSWPKSSLEFIAVLADSVTLTFRDPGPSLPRGEIRWAQVVRDSLMNSPPGFVQLSHAGVEQAIRDSMSLADSAIWLLDAEGMPLSEVPNLGMKTQNSFMLGDHRGFDRKTRQMADEYGIRRISFGKTSYLGSHCVAVVISEYERMDQ
jgi:tRNA pseudouridine-54 N-methylase